MHDESENRGGIEREARNLRVDGGRERERERGRLGKGG